MPLAKKSNRTTRVIHNTFNSEVAIGSDDSSVKVTPEVAFPAMNLMSRLKAYVMELEREKRSAAAKRGHEVRRNKSLAQGSTQPRYNSQQPLGDTNDA